MLSQTWCIYCYYTTKGARGPITKIKQSDCSVAGPIFSKYWTGWCPEWFRAGLVRPRVDILPVRPLRLVNKTYIPTFISQSRKYTATESQNAANYKSIGLHCLNSRFSPSRVKCYLIFNSKAIRATRKNGRLLSGVFRFFCVLRLRFPQSARK